ncbi:zinc ribbon domain-containing protein [Chloroflexota bacterium]
MPIYEYECTKCGEKFELRRSMSDDDSNIKCPGCGKGQPKKVLSTFFDTNSSSYSSSGKSCAPSGST